MERAPADPGLAPYEDNVTTGQVEIVHKLMELPRSPYLSRITLSLLQERQVPPHPPHHPTLPIEPTRAWDRDASDEGRNRKAKMTRWRSSASMPDPQLGRGETFVATAELEVERRGQAGDHRGDESGCCDLDECSDQTEI